MRRGVVDGGRGIQSFLGVTRVIAHVQRHELKGQFDRLLVPLLVVTNLIVGLHGADKLAVEDGRAPAALALLVPHKAGTLARRLATL